MAKPTILKSEAKDALWHKGILSWKLDSTQKELYKLYYESNFKVQTWLLSRRQGKCLAKGTLVMTPSGAKPIEDIKAGELVYGYDYDHKLSLTPVIEVIDSGIKKVRNIQNFNQTLAASTDEHKWLWVDYKKEIKEKPLGEVSTNTNKLARFFIDAPMGAKNVQDAYALGALIGDGCSKQNANGNNLYISSEDSVIPQAVGMELGCYFHKQTGKNHTWRLSNKSFVQKGVFSEPLLCSYYDLWVKNRYAHEKIIDLEEIKTWNRTSLLKLLAGLLDTDGCVSNKNNRLRLIWAMQSKSAIDAIQWCLLNLFQYRANIVVDNRSKYKNGPVYEIDISSNVFSKRALKELDQHLWVARKKWKKEYEKYPDRNQKEDSVGVKLGDYYEAHCYDLALANESHMYATVDGLITHNTYTLCVLALEMCLRNPNRIVKFVSPTKIQVNNNVRPLFKKLLEDCPPELQPHFKANDYIYYFPNGSEIQLAGTDSKHAEKLRGGDSHAAFVDEAGSCDDLDNVIKSILLPTTLITKGKIILAGTPPADADHEFLRYIEEGEQRGSLIKKTVHDNPRITKEDLKELETELGGVESDAYKRELLCELIKDPSRAVIPEFTRELEAEIVCDWVRPPHFDAYESMDIGGKDLTVVLFAYFDFRNNKIIVEDELVLNFQQPDVGISTLVKGIQNKEKDLWFNPLTNEQKTPYKRYSDIMSIVTQEIKKESNFKISFTDVERLDNEASINFLREKLQKRQIIIHPRCTTLINHMRNVKWRSKDKAIFARSPDYGHYDAVDALKYLVRYVDTKKNPFPPGWDRDTRDVYIIDKDRYYGKSSTDAYKRIFNLNRTASKKEESSEAASQNEKAREIIKKRWS